MAVLLSPVGGVAAQFFDNSGYPLTGGKLYSYAAGSTTPQQTYTSNSGNTPHSNPIILDSAGRVSNGGEVWLTDGSQYKFVLKTSTDTLIATYDNIVGINSIDAQQVSYDPPFTGAVPTNVEAKLAQTVSVKDFGAVGDGVTDDTASIETAIAASGGKTLVFPYGNYLIKSELTISTANVHLLSYGATITEGATFANTSLIRVSAQNVTIDSFTIVGANTDKIGITCSANLATGATISGNDVSGCGYGIVGHDNSDVTITGNNVHGNGRYGIYCQNTTGVSAYKNITVTNNKVDTSHLDPATSLMVCILVRGDATYQTTAVLVSDNNMVMPLDPTNSAALGCEMRFIKNGVFSGNRALNGAMLVSVAASELITVDGNTGNNQTFYGIEVAGLTGNPCKDIVVSNNTIDGGGILNQGIALQGLDANVRCSVTGNTVRGTTTHGIYAHTYWDNVSVANNSVYNAAGIGIYANGAAADQANSLSISGNVVGGGGTYGISLNTCSNVSIVGNTFDNLTTAGISLYAVDATMDYITMLGNIFSSTVNVEVLKSVSGTGAFGSHIMVMGSPDFRATSAVGTNSLDYANTVVESWSAGTPEGVITANIGSTYRRTSGSIGQSLYVKESGTGNTGWNSIATSDGSVGGAGSGGAGNQYIAINVGGLRYKVLHDGTF